MALSDTLERLASPWEHLAQRNPLVGFEGESYDGKGHDAVSPIFFFEAVSDPLYSFRSSIP